MKYLTKYIIEKLHLNKNIKNYKITLNELEDFFKDFLEKFEGGKYINNVKYFATKSTIPPYNEVRLSMNIGSTKPSFMSIDTKDKFLNQAYLVLKEFGKDRNYIMKDPLVRISTTIFTFKENNETN